MTPAARLPHLVQTASSARATRLLRPVVLRAARALSPTVRLLRFSPIAGADAAAQFSAVSALPDDVDFTLPRGAPLHYEGGQWVDLLAPDVPQIGGFSFVSAPDAPPSLLSAVDTAARDDFDLAVKVGRSPPAVWAHAAQLGAVCAVRVGGTLTVRAALRAGDDGGRWRHPRVLLIAGGVGINPLYSMLLDLAAARARGGDVPHIALLASFSSVAEFIFREELAALARGPLAGRLTVHATITRCGDARVPDGGLERGRLTHARIARAVGVGGDVSVVICGPPQMADDAVLAARAAGVDAADVSLERWW